MALTEILGASAAEKKRNKMFKEKPLGIVGNVLGKPPVGEAAPPKTAGIAGNLLGAFTSLGKEKAVEQVENKKKKSGNLTTGAELAAGQVGGRNNIFGN